MKLAAYYLGVPVRMRSAFAPKVVARRINSAAGSNLFAFKPGVAGHARFGGLLLRYRRSLGEYNAKPVLAGRLQPAPGGCNLILRYRAPTWFYFFGLIWYLALGFFAFAVFFRPVPEQTSGDLWLFMAVLLLFLAFPQIMTAAGTGESDDDLALLLAFLKEHAEAVPALD